MSYAGKYIFILNSDNDPGYMPGFWVATPKAFDTREEILATGSFNISREPVPKAGLDIAYAGVHAMQSVQDGKTYPGKIYRLRIEA
ncbi:MAG: hypothetical protein KJ871_04455 [Alphaproteobacteria bacterium]|nr:hypothetical protein [Alphaproteobacteria bacterium]MBU2083941.1 hypothetical protein [Alphaproteobacteria bacterium]MBU2142293.1 hypothetical protein [Alphaproteobacteria bacterium]MBU2196491.1 hypothetical protein [Alphaproteobacteria bacterium]